MRRESSCKVRTHLHGRSDWTAKTTTGELGFGTLRALFSREFAEWLRECYGFVRSTAILHHFVIDDHGRSGCLARG